MKEIIISADGDSVVYSVPDDVANHLRKYCIEFCDKWMKTSPHAKRYRIKGVYCYSLPELPLLQKTISLSSRY